VKRIKLLATAGLGRHAVNCRVTPGSINQFHVAFTVPIAPTTGVEKNDEPGAVAEMNTVPIGGWSVIIMLLALDGPWLVAVIAQVICVPATAVAGAILLALTFTSPPNAPVTPAAGTPSGSEGVSPVCPSACK